MEGNKEQLNCEFKSLFQDWIDTSEEEQNTLSMLFPEIPKDYFADKEDVLSPVKWRPKVMPYIRRRDLNSSQGEPDNKAKTAWEIGVKGTF